MRILVIGANGFIGRNIVLECLNRGWRVHGIYNRNNIFIPKKCLSFHISTLEKLKNNYDVVFLALGNYKYSHSELIETNIKIPLRSIKKFLKSRLVFISSTEVYGVHKGVIDETSSFNNPTLYGISKIGGEFIIRSFPNSSVARLTYVYGLGMDENLFISRAIKDAKDKKMISVFGDGKRIQNYLYIKDAVEYCIRIAMHKNPGTFLCTNQKSYSNKEVANIIKSSFLKCKIVFVGSDSSPSYFFNNKESSKVLGYSALHSMEAGLKDYILSIK